MGNVHNMILHDDDPADFVVAVKFTSNRPYSSMSSDSTRCMLEQGATSTDELNPVTCEIQASAHQIVFRNVNKFTGTLLRFYFLATTPNNNVASTAVELRVYANSQAYASSDGWALVRGTTGGYTMAAIYYSSGSHSSTSAPGIPSRSSQLFDNNWVEHSNGYTKILSYSSTHISLRIYRGANYGFDNVYRMTFRFYTERFSVSGCNDVTFSSSRYSNNHKT